MIFKFHYSIAHLLNLRETEKKLVVQILLVLVHFLPRVVLGIFMQLQVLLIVILFLPGLDGA